MEDLREGIENVLEKHGIYHKAHPDLPEDILRYLEAQGVVKKAEGLTDAGV